MHKSLLYFSLYTISFLAKPSLINFNNPNKSEWTIFGSLPREYTAFCPYINIHDYFISYISRASWVYSRVYMDQLVMTEKNLDSGIGSKGSDSAVIFFISCHSNVATFAPRCAPRIFDNPIVISIICTIANNDHRMINFKRFSPRCSWCLTDSMMKIRLVSCESFGWTMRSN